MSRDVRGRVAALVSLLVSGFIIVQVLDVGSELAVWTSSGAGHRPAGSALMIWFPLMLVVPIVAAQFARNTRYAGAARLGGACAVATWLTVVVIAYVK